MEYHIRFAKEQDIEQLVGLCKAHATYEKVNYDTANKAVMLSKHLFDSDQTVKCLVVEQHKEILGYATFMKQFSTWDADYYIYLCCLYLKEKTRGCGIGGMIMSRVKEYAKKENCTIIQWQTPSFNTNAIAFYNSLGAVAINKERFIWTI